MNKTQNNTEATANTSEMMIRFIYQTVERCGYRIDLVGCMSPGARVSQPPFGVFVLMDEHYDPKTGERNPDKDKPIGTLTGPNGAHILVPFTSVATRKDNKSGKFRGQDTVAQQITEQWGTKLRPDHGIPEVAMLPLQVAELVADTLAYAQKIAGEDTEVEPETVYSMIQRGPSKIRAHVDRDLSYVSMAEVKRREEEAAKEEAAKIAAAKSKTKRTRKTTAK